MSDKGKNSPSPAGKKVGDEGATTSQGQFLVYPAENGRIKIDVRMENETVWLTQQHMADLFQTTQQNISLHLQNIYDEGELQRAATHKEYLSVRQEGSRQVKRPLDFYNLDAIISVGYRVKSAVATRFRIWATQQLREYIVKGFILDDERLKNPDQPFDYFDELLRRIQDIRTSERRFYQKITDIYATSIDYDPTRPESILFFQTVQNKLHWAITGQTAAEIIHTRADASKLNMGLTNWRGSKVRKQDVAIAKNYLDADELAALNNLVEQYLVFAEGQAMRRIPMHMQEWITKLNAFLTINDRDILEHAGKITHELALARAEAEYEAFNPGRIARSDLAESDFDKAIQQLPPPKPKKRNPSKPPAD
ncbi:MAG: virulence RhuM family protein [Kiritimatiellales bacterium]|nr:virulence RhuM family protein [Kiritimatiellota bacterium]MBL7011957.1 virulence RhuM family protein [Kiritimatiellales bacterium]